MQDMLIKHLGFASTDVELSYFDVDPSSGPKKCTLSQDPPTVANFERKFKELCRSATLGDIRFLYVDAHGTSYEDEDHSGEPDDKDEGWSLAGNDDGTRRAIVSDDWVAETLRAVSTIPFIFVHNLPRETI